MDQRAGREGDRERQRRGHSRYRRDGQGTRFDEVDFGSYFQDYLDPGYRTTSNYEDLDRPSFEYNFFAAQHAL